MAGGRCLREHPSCAPKYRLLLYSTKFKLGNLRTLRVRIRKGRVLRGTACVSRTGLRSSMLRCPWLPLEYIPMITHGPAPICVDIRTVPTSQLAVKGGARFPQPASSRGHDTAVNTWDGAAMSSVRERERVFLQARWEATRPWILRRITLSHLGCTYCHSVLRQPRLAFWSRMLRWPSSTKRKCAFNSRGRMPSSSYRIRTASCNTRAFAVRTGPALSGALAGRVAVALRILSTSCEHHRIWRAVAAVALPAR